jgi:hypothetical protein
MSISSSEQRDRNFTVVNWSFNGIRQMSPVPREAYLGRYGTLEKVISTNVTIFGPMKHSDTQIAIYEGSFLHLLQLAAKKL